MEGMLMIRNVDAEPIGIWRTMEEKIIEAPEILVDLFRDYDDSEMYNEEGIDGFESFVKEKSGYVVERVFLDIHDL